MEVTMSNVPVHDPHTLEKTPEKTSAPARPLRSVNEVMAGWASAPFTFLFDRRTKRLVILVSILLILSIILSTVLLIGGRNVYFNFTTKPREESAGEGDSSISFWLRR